jgi:hypothetical protein
MNINNPTIRKLREEVRAAQEVFEMAVTLREVWKPAAQDEELHKRLGVSYATHSFTWCACSAPNGHVRIHGGFGG